MRIALQSCLGSRPASQFLSSVVVVRRSIEQDKQEFVAEQHDGRK